MKKLSVILGVAALSIAMSIAAFASPEIEYKKLRDSSETLVFEWTYPDLSGFEVKSSPKLINAFYYDEAVKSLEELKGMAKDEFQESKDSNWEKPKAFVSKNSCKAEQIFDHYLSVKTELFEFVGGGAGSTKDIYDLFDLNTGEIIPITNFFTAELDYPIALAAFCVEDLRAQLAKDSCEFIEDGALSTDENYKNIGITKDGLVVCFGQYQVTDAACGIRTVIIPFDKLGDILNPAVLDFIKKK